MSPTQVVVKYNRGGKSEEASVEVFNVLVGKADIGEVGAGMDEYHIRNSHAAEEVVAGIAGLGLQNVPGLTVEVVKT
jgi:hypothetical protein